MRPTFFASHEDFRRWLAEHHESERELWVGFRKVGTGERSMTWPEAVDEALCYGWIDGVRRRVDDASYAIRFTPRRPNSAWSAVNVGRATDLALQGRMQPAGLAAFERRAASRTGVYSYEQRAEASLDPEAEAEFRANGAAWEFFEAQAPSYRQAAVWWVVSARRDDTRRRRLATLIEDSAHGRRLGQFTRATRRRE